MEAKTFYNILNPSAIFDKMATDDLVQIQGEYPYFQLAAMISLKAVKQNKIKYYKKHLAIVASRVISREVLFDFIYPEYQYAVENKTEPVKVVASAEITIAPKPISKIAEQSNSSAANEKASDDVKSKSELMAEVKSRLTEIERDNKIVEKNSDKKENKSSSEIHSTTAPTIEGNDSKQEKISKHASVSKAKKKIKPINRGSSLNIIESFIKTNPSINRPEDKTYDAEIALANKSLEESYELVSETMAELFIKQGHPKKAIKVYEKLILIYPEKSTYFASRILNLKD